MARLKVIFALALAAVAANDSVDVVDGNTNGFDGAPCTSEQTLCDDGACCATENWCCYGVVPPCVGIKILRRVRANRRVDLHAIDATPARWRGDAGSSPLDGASAATSSPRNDLVKNYRVHPTHCLISTQVPGLRELPPGG